MGEVYKARDLKLNRMVALKILRPDQNADPSLRQRFLQEAQAASALNHPNIITIHDVIDEPGMDIMVMEFVDGRTLNELIPRGGLRVSQVLHYAAQVADALAAAHAAGIIHRDLKPGNIMVTDRDHVKLLDFGLAKLATPNFSQDPDATNMAPLTVQGSIVGTLCYMSPEQAQGLPADHRSDIFSFGAVLYEMATGLRAFTGENGISMLSSVLRDHPRRVLEITPDVPPVLSDVIHRCLEKDPAARFQSMAELRDTLNHLRQQSASGAFLSQTVVVAPQTPPAPPAKRSPLPLILGALGLSAGAAALWLQQRPAPAPPPAPTQVEAPVVNKPSPVPAEPAPAPASAPVAASAPPPPAPVARVIEVPDDTPVPLSLQTDIPADAEPGLPLEFKVTDDVKVGAETVIQAGAKAVGEFASREKKKQFLVVGKGTKVMVQLKTVEGLNGAKLKLRDAARQIETPGLKSKTIAVAKGAPLTARTEGRQAVHQK